MRGYFSIAGYSPAPPPDGRFQVLALEMRQLMSLRRDRILAQARFSHSWRKAKLSRFRGFNATAESSRIRDLAAHHFMEGRI
jgi:hypothetical protein